MSSNFYDWAVVKSTLTEQEKERALCLFFSGADTSSVNWEKATTDFGSKSVDSMRVSMRNLFKKLEKAGGASRADDESAVKKSVTKHGGKRKVKNGDLGDAAAPKKRGRKAKIVVAEADDEEKMKEDQVKEEKVEKDGDEDA